MKETEKDQWMKKIQELAQEKTTAHRNEREYNFQKPCQNVNDKKKKEQWTNKKGQHHNQKKKNCNEAQSHREIPMDE